MGWVVLNERSQRWRWKTLLRFEQFSHLRVEIRNRQIRIVF